MAKKKDPESTEIFAKGPHFSIIQLPQDLLPKPPAQRIIQLVNKDGKLTTYVSENAYHRAELITWFDRLIRLAYQFSISKGAAHLFAIKGRIHWCKFTEDFCRTLKGPRINPETDLPEPEVN